MKQVGARGRKLLLCGAVVVVVLVGVVIWLFTQRCEDLRFAVLYPEPNTAEVLLERRFAEHTEADIVVIGDGTGKASLTESDQALDTLSPEETTTVKAPFKFQIVHQERYGVTEDEKKTATS